jgi:hypothetical protein
MVVTTMVVTWRRGDDDDDSLPHSNHIDLGRTKREKEGVCVINPGVDIQPGRETWKYIHINKFIYIYIYIYIYLYICMGMYIGGKERQSRKRGEKGE